MTENQAAKEKVCPAKQETRLISKNQATKRYEFLYQLHHKESKIFFGLVLPIVQGARQTTFNAQYERLSQVQEGWIKEEFQPLGY